MYSCIECFAHVEFTDISLHMIPADNSFVEHIEISILYVLIIAFKFLSDFLMLKMKFVLRCTD